jgi:hypothetical protein
MASGPQGEAAGGGVPEGATDAPSAAQLASLIDCLLQGDDPDMLEAFAKGGSRLADEHVHSLLALIADRRKEATFSINLVLSAAMYVLLDGKEQSRAPPYDDTVTDYVYDRGSVRGSDRYTRFD